MTTYSAEVRVTASEKRGTPLEGAVQEISELFSDLAPEGDFHYEFIPVEEGSIPQVKLMVEAVDGEYTSDALIAGSHELDPWYDFLLAVQDKINLIHLSAIFITLVEGDPDSLSIGVVVEKNSRGELIAKNRETRLECEMCHTTQSIDVVYDSSAINIRERRAVMG